MSTIAQMNLRDVIANRPAASIAGRIFYATDTGAGYRDNGSSWDIWMNQGGSGNTAGRPVTSTIGVRYFDTTLGYVVWWNGSNWVDDTGTVR